MNNNIFLEILKKEVVPALGCTEPIAVAYAVAKATAILNKKPEKIELWLSGNIIKNAMGVGIPSTGMVGLDISAALGAIGGDSSAELEVLKDITQTHLQLAKEMIDANKIEIHLKECNEKLYIEAICKTNTDFSKVIIKKLHSNIVFMQVNENVLLEKSEEVSLAVDSANDVATITVSEIFEFATMVPFKDIEFILKGAEMNKLVSKEGLATEYGLQVGRKIKNSRDTTPFSSDLSSRIISGTAAASDARMSGSPLPIMTTAGSGNQGITVTMPSVILAEELGKSKEELARALVIGNLITIHIKSYVGRLSPLCGCGVAAATGTSCALTYLSGGKLENINFAIKNMVGDLSGIICDGAKPSCALKIATAVSAAIQCSILALNNIGVSEKDGIVHANVEQTIKNLATLGTKGMESTDKVILDMMVCK